jgi:hypothetical protein
VSWEGVELSRVTESAPVLPTVGAGQLIYPGGRHWFSGEPESGKTIAAYAIGLEVLRCAADANRPWVCLVDFEMSAHLARQRFIEMGASDDELCNILYVSPDAGPTEDDWRDVILDPAPALMIYDAFAGAAALLGIDDHRGKDIERFAATYIVPAWEAGVSTIVLDHVTKSRENRGRWSIGSERKLGISDVALGFDAIKRPRRGHDGLINIKTHKDRFGHLNRPQAAALHLHSDRATHAITWSWSKPTAAVEPGTEWRPTVYMDRVSQYLEQHGSSSRTAIYNAGLGKREFLVHAVTHLVDGATSKTTVPGSFPSNRSATRNPVPRFPSRSRPFPRPRFPSVPTVPLLRGGNGERGSRPRRTRTPRSHRRRNGALVTVFFYSQPSRHPRSEFFSPRLMGA